MRVAIYFLRVSSYVLPLLVLVAVPGQLYSDVVVRPEQAVYYVAPGETFQLHVHIDANDQTLGNIFEPLPDGLFSYGVTVSHPGGMATIPSVSQIVPVPQLNYFGFSSPALRQVAASAAMIKGNIDVAAGVAYANSLLFTIQITNLAPTSSSYWIDLDEWRTLGPSEQIFIDGAGGVLDTVPSTDLFLPALVVVVPEPSTFEMLVVSGFCAVGVRRKCRLL